VVYAFEPFPPNLDQLRRNAAQSRHGNITVFPLALSDHSTSAPFVVPPFGNSGRGHLLGLEKEKASEPPRDAVVEVRCTTLDSLLPQLRPPKLVVTDAEGHDAAILYGSEQLLAKHQPVIVLEARDRLLARAGTSSEELAKYLLDLDYGLFEIARFRLEPIDVDDGRVRRWTDWVAVPASNRDVVDRIRRILRKSGLMPCIARLNPLRREHDARAP
jgi:FkbM family methyltransferase